MTIFSDDPKKFVSYEWIAPDGMIDRLEGIDMGNRNIHKQISYNRFEDEATPVPKKYIKSPMDLKSTIMYRSGSQKNSD